MLTRRRLTTAPRSGSRPCSHSWPQWHTRHVARLASSAPRCSRWRGGSPAFFGLMVDRPTTCVAADGLCVSFGNDQVACALQRRRSVGSAVSKDSGGGSRRATLAARAPATTSSRTPTGEILPRPWEMADASRDGEGALAGAAGTEGTVCASASSTAAASLGARARQSPPRWGALPRRRRGCLGDGQPSPP